jgi:putative peptidoglycan lipid II flippase
VRTSSVISALAAVGVLSGFVVDAALAALFGAGATTDAFFIAGTIPFAVASVLLASANQALVPLISSWFKEQPRDVALVRVGRLLGSAVLIALGVAIVGAVASPVIPKLIAPGSSSRTKELAAGMSLLLFITVVTRTGAEVLRALLNARFSFVIPAAMPVVESVSVLAVMFPLAPRLGITSVAVGYVVGGFLQLGFMAGVAHRRRLSVRPRVGFRDPEIRRGLRLLTLPLTATGLNMGARATERFLASFLPAGSITILNYAWVIVNSLGGAIFFRSVIVALLPRLSEAKEDERASVRILVDGIRIMAVISLPLTALVIVLAEPLIAFAFQRGAFTAGATALLASVLAIYALQFPLDAFTRVLLSHAYARLDMVTPFKNGVLGVVLDIVLAAALFLLLGVQGLALAYVLASVGNLTHAFLAVRSRVRLDVRPLLRLLGKTAVASAVGGFAALAVLRVLPAATDILWRAMRLGVPGIVGLAAVAGALLVLRVRMAAALRRR